MLRKVSNSVVGFSKKGDSCHFPVASGEPQFLGTRFSPDLPGAADWLPRKQVLQVKIILECWRM